MGHANLTNISEVFVDLLCKQESVSVAEVVAELQRRGETVHASEGEYDDPYMLSYSCENVLEHLLERHGTTARTPDRKKAPIVEAVEPLTRMQEQILKEWHDGETDDWEDGEDREYAVLGSIRWRRTPTWAKVARNRIPLLGDFTN